MDGNGRWARKRGLPRVAGHQAGVRAVRGTVRACARLGIGYLTLYAFSADNWKRPRAEVKALMGLLVHFLRRELAELEKNGIKLRTMGDIRALPAAARAELARVIRRTRNNRGLVLNLALNYSGRQEVMDAAVRMAQELNKGHGSFKGRPDREKFRAFLYSPDIPDPDLLIRTSGEMRLSDFMLWQGAYTELWFTPVLWPDFGKKHLAEGLRSFARRQRRFGGVDAVGDEGGKGGGRA